MNPVAKTRAAIETRLAMRSLWEEHLVYPPKWSKKTLEKMLQTHLDLTTGEVLGRLNKDCSADIMTYVQGHAHMLMFSDLLSDGIARQFPARFRK